MLAAIPAAAQKKYDPGASDTEIKIGNINPYSGPASAYGLIGKTIEAYFKKINEEGGINGRKINFISYDDDYSPPKAVEQARKLVESDEVLLLFQCARHAVEHGDPEIHELEEGAAALRRDRRDEMGRPEELPLDHGLAADLPVARAGSTPSSCSTGTRTPRSASSTRTTITGRTTSRASRTGSATRRRR